MALGRHQLRVRLSVAVEGMAEMANLSVHGPASAGIGLLREN